MQGFPAAEGGLGWGGEVLGRPAGRRDCGKLRNARARHAEHTAHRDEVARTQQNHQCFSMLLYIFTPPSLPTTPPTLTKPHPHQTHLPHQSPSPIFHSYLFQPDRSVFPLASEASAGGITQSNFQSDATPQALSSPAVPLGNGKLSHQVQTHFLLPRALCLAKLCVTAKTGHVCM